MLFDFKQHHTFQALKAIVYQKFYTETEMKDFP